MRCMCERNHPSFVKLLSANRSCLNTAGNSPEGNTAGGHIEGLLSLLYYNQLSINRINTKGTQRCKKPAFKLWFMKVQWSICRIFSCYVSRAFIQFVHIRTSKMLVEIYWKRQMEEFLHSTLLSNKTFSFNHFCWCLSLWNSFTAAINCDVTVTLMHSQEGYTFVD